MPKKKSNSTQTSASPVSPIPIQKQTKKLSGKTSPFPKHIESLVVDELMKNQIEFMFLSNKSFQQKQKRNQKPTQPEKKTRSKRPGTRLTKSDCLFHDGNTRRWTYLALFIDTSQIGQIQLEFPHCVQIEHQVFDPNKVLSKDQVTTFPQGKSLIVIRFWIQNANFSEFKIFHKSFQRPNFLPLRHSKKSSKTTTAKVTATNTTTTATSATTTTAASSQAQTPQSSPSPLISINSTQLPGFSGHQNSSQEFSVNSNTTPFEVAVSDPPFPDDNASPLTFDLESVKPLPDEYENLLSLPQSPYLPQEVDAILSHAYETSGQPPSTFNSFPVAQPPMDYLNPI